MSRQNTTSGLSGNQLKLCAIAAMALDHLAWTLWPGYAHKEWWILLIHIIGRLAAPVMVHDLGRISVHPQFQKVPAAFISICIYFAFCL